MNVRGFGDGRLESGRGYAPLARVDGDVYALCRVRSEHRADVGDAHRAYVRGCVPWVREHVDAHAARSDATKDQSP